MRKTLLIMIIVALCSLQAWPQTQTLVRVKGRITDKDSQQPLADATVALLYAKDSSRAVSGFTDKDGGFLLEGVKAGAYRLYVTFLGYQPVFRPVEVGVADTLVDLGGITIQGNGVNLKMVEIVRVRAPMVVKKDTLEFNAEYYKTRENAVMEELLKKLPGIQIEKDGTIKVNGETVKKILVDGKPFFGGDPKLATRNLPADMIDKIQLIDRKSDQAQFTGSDDGKREKAINITVKKERKEAFLGRVSAGYGTHERFAGNGSLNRFNDDEQLSFLGNANNVNNSGFLEGSGQGVGGGGNGITRSWYGGANYSRDLGKKLKVSGSYMANYNSTENQRNSARQNFLPDTIYYYNQDAYSADNVTNQILDMRVEYKPDTMHFLTVASNFNYVTTSNLQENLYESLRGKQQLINSGNMVNINSSTMPNFSTAVSFGKRFKKTGRTFSSSLAFIYNGVDQEAFNRSNNLFVQPNGETDIDTINQHNYTDSRHLMIQLFLTYTEPIFKDRFLEFTYTYTRDYTSASKFTYDYNASKGVYDRLNDSLSNSFERISFLQFAGISIRTQKAKYDYSVGLNIQISDLENNNISQQDVLQQHIVNYSPFAFFNYAFTNNNRLRFLYSGNPQPPNVIQLQPVPDNSNPLYIQLGNPDLKPALMHNINMSYNAFNPGTMHGFSAYVNATLTNNKIINANWFDSMGRQVSQPLNMNGSYNINANMENSFPFTKKQIAINANTTFIFNREMSYINGIKGSTKNFSIGQGFSFNYTYKELFDLSIGGSANYNGVRYAIQKDNNTNYFIYNSSINCNVHLPLGFIIGGNLDYMLNAGRAAGYNLSATMLNAAISKSVFRHKQALIKVQGFDLLNRNLSISRNVGENYIEDVQTKVLQRFFMVSFSYFLKPNGDNK